MFEKGEGGGATGLFDEKTNKLTYAITNVVNKKWEKVTQKFSLKGRIISFSSYLGGFMVFEKRYNVSCMHF